MCVALSIFSDHYSYFPFKDLNECVKQLLFEAWGKGQFILNDKDDKYSWHVPVLKKKADLSLLTII